MRTTLFRGKALSSNSWEYGYYFISESRHYIQWAIKNHESTWCEVDPNTVGEFTGITDGNLVKIFEGDIVSFCRKTMYSVSFLDGAFVLHHYKCLKEIDGSPLKWGPLFRVNEHGLPCKVVGNIHDS